MEKNIKEMIEYPREGILSKEMIKDTNSNVSLFCMASGSEMSEHTSTKKGFVYVLEGLGTFNLQGKNIRMEPGIFLFMDKNAKHSLKAEENTSFLLILTK